MDKGAVVDSIVSSAVADGNKDLEGVKWVKGRGRSVRQAMIARVSGSGSTSFRKLCNFSSCRVAN